MSWQHRPLPLRVVSVAALTVAAAAIVLGGCSATESNRRISTSSVDTYQSAYSGPRHKLAIGKFENRSRYMNGIFADDNDRLAAQARQILKAHLVQSNRFTVLDRMNLDETEIEADRAGTQHRVVGSDFIVTGAVTEFGRRDTGRVDAVFHASKTQTAFAKVTVSVVDVRSTAVICSYQGAGEFELTNRHVMGFGSTAGYDATLTDKVINLAMIEVVNRMTEGLDRGEWAK